MYNINIKYELKTFKNVEKDYIKSMCVRKRRIIKFLNRFNRREKYAICNTYLDWKTHICDILTNIKNPNDYDNMIHWLIRERNHAAHKLDAIKAILIPSYITIIELHKEFLIDIPANYSIFITMFLVVIFSTAILMEENIKVDFYNQFIEIAQERKKYIFNS